MDPLEQFSLPEKQHNTGEAVLGDHRQPLPLPPPGVLLGGGGARGRHPQGTHEDAAEQAQGVGERKHALRGRVRQGGRREGGQRGDRRGGGAGKGGGGCWARRRRRVGAA